MEAVLSREIPGTLRWRLIPVAFFLVGVGMLIFEVKKRTSPEIAGKKREATAKSKETETPQTEFITSLLFCLFWNGLCSFWYWKVWEMWKIPHTTLWAWFLPIVGTIFMIPFALIGGVMILDVFKTFFRLFNPVAKLTFSAKSAKPGDTVEVKWELAGRFERIQCLTLSLFCCKDVEAGTENEIRPAEETLQRIEIEKIRGPLRQRMGLTRVKIPADAIPTGKNSDNRITWEIQLHGKISKWPDIVQAREIQVRFTADTDPGDEGRE